MMYASRNLATAVSATPVTGPLVSGDLITSIKGVRYSRGSTVVQSAAGCSGSVVSKQNR